MGFRSLVSLALLAIPVAVTIGILVSIDAYRTSNGLQKIFVDNGISNNTYCQKAYGISPDSVGQQYTLNPNQWGWTEGSAGSLCMNVTSFHNNTYATNATAPEFSVTWQYPQGPESQPVHAFPNIQYNGVSKGSLPVQISSLSSLNIDVQWSYGVGDQAVAQTDDSAMASVTANTNVAIDMFIDSSASSAQDTTKANYEVMVWLARYGAATQPIGLAQGAVTTAQIGSVTFSLYAGQNGLGQNVLTWVASTTQTEFVGDISPLLTGLSQVAASATTAKIPSSTDYLGYLGLGSEALYATTNVTFYVPRLAMTINK